jgi:DnaA-like protein
MPCKRELNMTNLLINEHPLMVLPSLATKVGLNEAIILQQIHYWLDPGINRNFREGVHWAYNTYKEWQKQFPFFSTRTIQRTIQSLEKNNLLIVRNFNKNQLDKTKWYTINYNTLNLLNDSSSRKCQNGTSSVPKCPDGGDKMAYSIYKATETTTKTTTFPSLNANFESNIKTQKLLLERGNKTINLKTKISSKMLDIWSKLVEEERKGEAQKLKLTEKRLKYLSSVLSQNFNGDIDQWSSFCETIASSKFLMGEITSFKATLDWVLLEKNLQKILDGNYTIGDREVFSCIGNYAQTKKEIIEEITREHTPVEWKEFKSKVLIEVGEETYRSWFSKLEFVGYSDRKLKIKALTGFIKQWIEDKYSDTLKRLLKDSFVDIENYELQV